MEKSIILIQIKISKYASLAQEDCAMGLDKLSCQKLAWIFGGLLTTRNWRDRLANRIEGPARIKSARNPQEISKNLMISMGVTPKVGVKVGV